MEQNLTQIKVIVVGDSGVGKSSILFRFVNDEFNEFSEATLGAAFVSKVHTYGQDKTIRFQVEMLISRSGIRPAKKNTSPSPPSTTDVRSFPSRVPNRTELFSALAEKYEEVKSQPAAGKVAVGNKLTSAAGEKKKKGGCCGGKEK
ncbi:GTP-binding protein ryh1 [Nymphaea colorata]|nr:GTP-binding protein ryh1 [Nymphaea colorata]